MTAESAIHSQREKKFHWGTFSLVNGIVGILSLLFVFIDFQIVKAENRSIMLYLRIASCLLFVGGAWFARGRPIRAWVVPYYGALFAVGLLLEHFAGGIESTYSNLFVQTQVLILLATAPNLRICQASLSIFGLGYGLVHFIKGDIVGAGGIRAVAAVSIAYAVCIIGSLFYNFLTEKSHRLENEVITEKKTAQQLRQASELKDHLFRDFEHMVRVPLLEIDMIMQHLRRQSEEASQEYHKITRNVRQLQLMTSSILQLSLGKREHGLYGYCVSASLESVIDALGAEAKSRIFVQSTGSEKAVHLPSSILTQVLFNVLSYVCGETVGRIDVGLHFGKARQRIYIASDSWKYLGESNAKRDKIYNTGYIMRNRHSYSLYTGRELLERYDGTLKVRKGALILRIPAITDEVLNETVLAVCRS